MRSLLVVVAAAVRVVATVVLVVGGGHAGLRLGWVFDPEDERASLPRYERRIDGRVRSRAHTGHEGAILSAATLGGEEP